jgi:hypothetical protein
MEFFVNRSGAWLGPYSAEQLSALIRAKRFARTDLAYSVAPGNDRIPPEEERLPIHYLIECDPPEKYSALLSASIPQFIVAFAALSYVCGYFAEFTFSGMLGLRGIALDALKGKYIYAGVLCLSFPFASGLLLAASCYNYNNPKPKKKDDAPIIYWPSAALIFLTLGTFYILVTFARPGTYTVHHEEVAWFFLSMSVGIVLVRLSEEASENARMEAEGKIPPAPRGFGWTRKACGVVPRLVWPCSRIALLLVGLILSYRIFRSDFPLIWEMLKSGGYLYFTLVVVVLVYVWRILRRLPSSNTTFIRRYVTMSCIPVIFSLGMLAVLFFGARVLPYIPVRKGGGDYTTERPSVIHFKGATTAIPGDLLQRRVGAEPAPGKPVPEEVVSKPVIVLEETLPTICVALYSPSAIHEWREPGPEKKPTIYNLDRSIIASVTLLDPERTRSEIKEWLSGSMIPGWEGTLAAITGKKAEFKIAWTPFLKDDPGEAANALVKVNRGISETLKQLVEEHYDCPEIKIELVSTTQQYVNSHEAVEFHGNTISVFVGEPSRVLLSRIKAESLRKAREAFRGGATP